MWFFLMILNLSQNLLQKNERKSCGGGQRPPPQLFWAAEGRPLIFRQSILRADSESCEK